ncbi:PadR family transcriptional regulator [Nonomuraea sp. NPDC049695]|uniref:PadR family transcriptional regulator n=1 Tax=Nonomuraea sp. NPDC049695 TaxID=3154734 RepID=UPI0034363505
MNSSRLFVLGMLARKGPMHGHQIRRAAQIDRTDLWADVKPGSLYGALHRMEGEGLIEAVRTEQEGKMPARTVYGITEEGRRELHAQRDEALRRVALPPDPADLALQFTDDMAEQTLGGVLRNRREAYATQLQAMRNMREEADPYLTDLERMTFQHTLARLETEVAWHDEVLRRLPKLVADDDRHRSRSARPDTPEGDSA